MATILFIPWEIQLLIHLQSFSYIITLYKMKRIYSYANKLS
jgi:hypothetical protein